MKEVKLKAQLRDSRGLYTREGLSHYLKRLYTRRLQKVVEATSRVHMLNLETVEKGTEGPRRVRKCVEATRTV